MRRVAALLSLLTIASCGPESVSDPEVVVDPWAEVVLERAAWDGASDTASGDPGDGEALTTVHFRVLTTGPRRRLLDVAPSFLESAIETHRTVRQRIGTDGPVRDPRVREPLPAPSDRIVVYLVHEREAWRRVLEQAVRDQPIEPFVDLAGRGIVVGFSQDDAAYAFAPPEAAGASGLGSNVLRLLAHESWHLYARQTFRQPLPIWLDESFATSVEGYRAIDGEGFDVSEDSEDAFGFRFDPWANATRSRDLVDLVLAGRRWYLGDLLKFRPDHEAGGVGVAGPDAARELREYYAQVWALGRMLEMPQFSEQVLELITAAERGTMGAELARRIPPDEIRASRGGRYGDAAFRAFVSEDIPAADAFFGSFLINITSRDNREAILEGRSPFEAESDIPEQEVPDLELDSEDNDDDGDNVLRRALRGGE